LLMLSHQDLGAALERATSLGLPVPVTIGKPLTPLDLVDAVARALGQPLGQARREEKGHSYRKGERQSLQGAHLLVVEDNAFNQELVRDLLSGAGVSVEIAANGLEALQMLETGSYDGILMDCQMPVMD
ncbi:MAG: response regulator, partial [Gammaproteobacteria bacterium]|nr:response regulator [Gammaproteobacteria bacterium]